jgi:DNA-binding PadR family transcriptional regulator
MKGLKPDYRRLLIYSRLGALSYMHYYGESGIAYRDIKAALDLSDSRLGPQLLWMRKNGYAKIKEEKSDGTELSVYYIQPKGKAAYEAVISWLGSIPLGRELEEKRKKGENDE